MTNLPYARFDRISMNYSLGFTCHNDAAMMAETIDVSTQYRIALSNLYVIAFVVTATVVEINDALTCSCIAAPK